MQANERMDERVTQYLPFNSCLFQTTVPRSPRPKTRRAEKTTPSGAGKRTPSGAENASQNGVKKGENTQMAPWKGKPSDAAFDATFPLLSSTQNMKEKNEAGKTVRSWSYSATLTHS